MATEHPSGVHPNLDWSANENWIDKVGGWPKGNWIYRTAKHLVADAGMPRERAFPVAINAAKRLCATGDLNFPGVQQANPASRAQACAAVAQWNAMKLKARARGFKPTDG